MRSYKDIIKYRKVLFFILLCAFFTSVTAQNCCFNPYHEVYGGFCQDIAGSAALARELCCGDLSGLPITVDGEIYDYDYCVQYPWFEEAPCDLVVPECTEVCCVGQTKTCEEIPGIQCELDDEHAQLSTHPDYQKFFTQSCGQVSFCQEGCCCDDEHPAGGVMKKAGCKDPDVNFFTGIINPVDCTDSCAQALVPCEWSNCNGVNNIGCICGGITTPTTDTERWCCAVDQRVFGNSDDCRQESSCKAETYSISGIVRDDKNRLLAKVTITVGTITTETLDDGTYVVEGLTPGVYTINAEKEGYEIGETTRTVSDEDLTAINFVLRYAGICGNGIIEGTETCDDGNKVSGDGCSSICQVEGVCGDGVVQSPNSEDVFEECDLGPNNGRPGYLCTAECKLIGVCGNKRIDGEETCDKGKRCADKTTDCTDDISICPGGITECEVRAVEGCSETCHKDDETCEAGQTRVGVCTLKPITEEMTSPLDQKVYSYQCPTWEVCGADKFWKGICEKQDPDCPTTCTNLGGTYCPQHIPVCMKEPLYPDLVEDGYHGLVCCEGITKRTLSNPTDLCKAKPAKCEFLRCEQANTELPCPCGTTEATSSKSFCCAQSSAIFRTQGECFLFSDCSVSCLEKNPTEPVNIASEYPKGCFCYGETKTSGYCCTDDNWVDDTGKCKLIEFVNVEGYVEDKITRQPIEGAVVSVKATITDKTGTNPFMKAAVTRADGYYFLERIPKYKQGEVEYSYIMADKRHFYFPEIERTFEPTQGYVRKDFKLEPLPKYSIGGKVSDIDEPETMMGGAQVKINDLEETTATGSNGRYSFSEVVMGLHPFSTRVTGYKRKTIMHNTIDDFNNLDFEIRKINCTFGKYAGAPGFENRPFMVNEQGDPIEPDEPVLTLKNVSRIKDAVGLKIDWESACPAESFNIYRCNIDLKDCTQDRNWEIAKSVGKEIISYVDSFLEPGTNYCYKVGAEHVIPFYAEVLSKTVDEREALCERTADEECFIYQGTFCQGDSVMSCGGDDFVKTLVDNCTPAGNICGYVQGDAVCVAKTDCGKCNTPLGLFGKVQKVLYKLGIVESEHLCADVPVCYEDYTTTSVDKFYSCEDVTSCYDYRSEEACLENKCLPRTCVWGDDSRYAEFGFGVCREQNMEERCPGEQNNPDTDCDGAVNSVDKDDDNDGSPDEFDPDDMTGIDKYQNCSKCDDPNYIYDKIFQKCDKERCLLHGECFYSGTKCYNRNQVTCQDYKTAEDCAGPADNRISFDIDVSTNEIAVDANGVKQLSNDYFGFGVCRWDNGKCIKDVDRDATVDCGEIGYVFCWLDMAPPLTKFPARKAYSDDMMVYPSIIDKFTETYAGTDTYIKLVKQGEDTPSAQQIVTKIEDGNLDITELRKFYPGPFYEPGQDDYTLYYYSKNGVMNGRPPTSTESSSDNLENLSSFTFRYDNLDPKYINETEHEVGEFEKFFTGEELSYIISAYMTGEQSFATDLIINFTLSEEATCLLALRRANIYPAAACKDDLCLDYNDVIWEYGNYSDEYALLYKELEDGMYYFTYHCYDRVLNELGAVDVPIRIDADPSITIRQPEGTITTEADVIDLILDTGADIPCKWTYDLDSSNQDAFYPTPADEAKPFPIKEPIAEGHQHRDDKFDVAGVVAKGYMIRALCKTNYFGIRDDLFVFTVDNQAPNTVLEKTGSPPYTTADWYNSLSFRLRCEDPVIPDGKEFGCDKIYYCIGIDCDPVHHPEESQEPIITVTGDVAKDICYYSEDKGGNRGAKHCTVLRVDNIEPIIDGIQFDPQVTNKDYTFVNVLTDRFNYLSDSTLFNQEFTSRSDYTFNYDEPIPLNDVTFRAKVGFPQPIDEDVTTFDIVRIRASEDGENYYSVFIDSLQREIGLQRVEAGRTFTLGGGPKPLPYGNEFEIEIGALGNMFNVKVDGDLAILGFDSAFTKGLVTIPRVEGDNPIQRSISEVRIGSPGRTAPVKNSYLIVNEGKEGEERHDFNVPSYFRINLSYEGENTVDIVVEDNTIPYSNVGERRLIAYRDLEPPVADMDIRNVDNRQIAGLEYWAEYGTDVKFTIRVDDPQYSGVVAKFDIRVLSEEGEEKYTFSNVNPTIKSHSFTLDNLAVGIYELDVDSVDMFGNSGSQSTLFAVSDTIPPMFNFSVDSPTEEPGVVLRGPVYTVNVTATEPIQGDEVELRICIKGICYSAGFDFTIDTFSDDKTWFNFTFKLPYAPFTRELEEEKARFWIEAYDNNWVLGDQILEGRDFIIDTRGGPKPNLIYPLTDVVPFYTNKDHVMVTGFDGENKPGNDITVFVSNESFIDPNIVGEWLWSNKTLSLEGGQLFGTGKVHENASAGSKELTIERNDPLSPNMWVDFFGHSTETGLFYGVESNTPTFEGSEYATLVLERPLERAITQDQLNFNFYDRPYAGGWFSVNVSLQTGSNYLYAFSFDSHGVRSEAADNFVHAISDPYKPVIEIIEPYTEEEELTTPHLVTDKVEKIEARITENISFIARESINLNIDYHPIGIPQQFKNINCNCTGCSPEEAGTLECSSPDNREFSVWYIPAEGEMGNSVYYPTLKAIDRAGNAVEFGWKFEVDRNIPHDPVVKSPDGKEFDLILYTKDRNPRLFIDFLRDQGKYVKVWEVSILDNKTKDAKTILTIDGFDPDASWINPINYTEPIDENYSTNYTVDISGYEFDDGVYYIAAKASKLYGVSDTELNFSQNITVYGEFKVDNTKPKIKVEMTNPTMVKNPAFKIVTDDPSTCSYHTDEYPDDVELLEPAVEFEDKLDYHKLEMKQLIGVRYGKTQHTRHVLGNHEIVISCTNILELSNELTYPFKLVFPKRDKVFYKEGDKIELELKLDQPGLGVSGDFSSLGATAPVAAASTGTNYTLSYTVPQNPGIANGQYEINITTRNIFNEIVDQTSALIYYHNSKNWDFENDVQAAVSCYNSNNPGVYFGEIFCDLGSDLTFSLFKSKGLAVEEECDDGIDNDGDGDADCKDTDCGGIRYECRNVMNIVSAVNVSDPRNIIKLDLGGGTKLFHLANVKPGGTLRARFVMANIPGLSSQFSIKNIPQGWGVTQESASIVDNNNILTHFVPESGDQLQAGPAIYTGALNLLMDMPVGQNSTTLQFLRSVNDAIKTKFESSTVNVVQDAIENENEYSDSNYYGCYDQIDNDLDSTEWAFKNRDRNIDNNPVGANGVDCWDSDCDKKPARRADGAVCEYQTELTCYDGFDNDLDNDDGQPDYVASGGIDCRDINCDTKQGDKDNTNLKCEHRREFTCDDGFDNDAYQQKDCDLVETSDNPKSQDVYNKAEYDCQESCRSQKAINDEKGQLCNDNKDNDYDFFSPTAADKSQYLIGTKNANGGIDCRSNNPDPGCNGETFTGDSGRTGVCELNNEITCDDGFDNDQDSNYEPSAGWDSKVYNAYFGADKYFKGADCDDYSCAGNDACPSTENTVAAWCFDGADNDLDKVKDCKDIDCNEVKGVPTITGTYNDNYEPGALIKCEYEEEKSCTDGFDNDGDGKIDQEDDNCRAGVCYPFPAEEYIAFDSCSDGYDQDFSEGADCSDIDCDGLPCGPASTCQVVGGNRVCKSLIDEICNNNMDDDFDTLYDCYDPDCWGKEPCTTQLFAGMCKDDKNYDKDGKARCADEDCRNSLECKDSTATITLPNTKVKVSYNKYVRLGEKLKVRFQKSGVTDGVALAVGDESNPLSQITDPTQANTNVGAGFTKSVNPNGISAQNPTFSGNLDITIEITVTKAMFETKTLGLTARVAEKVDSETKISVFVSESTDPTLPGNYYIEKVAGGYRFWVNPSDAQTGINRCEFTRGDKKVTADQCAHVFETLTNGDKIKVVAWDGAGNSAENTYTINLPSITVTSFTLSEYVAPGDFLEFSATFTGASGGSCTARVYDRDFIEVVSDEFALSDEGECDGLVDITGLDNGSYSLAVEKMFGGKIYTTGYEQFFKCRYTQFPESDILPAGKFHCMDECQLTKPLPRIKIIKPTEGDVFVYPLINVIGEVEPNVTLDIFVNSLDEAQYQAEIKNVEIFDTKAMLIAKGENTITARVIDEDNLVNSDHVTVEFDGVRMLTDVVVNGLPDSIGSVDVRFNVIDVGEIIDLDETAMKLYMEDAADIEMNVTKVDYPGEKPKRIRLTPIDTITEPGIYKVEVIPKMESGKYGVGKVYRFSYCPDGSHVFYEVLPRSKTRHTIFAATGNMTPPPKSAKLVFIQADGVRKTKDLEFDPVTGRFDIIYPDLIQKEGLNSYYITTILETEEGAIKCDDVRRAVMYDIRFEGIELPYVKGEKAKVYETQAQQTRQGICGDNKCEFGEDCVEDCLILEDIGGLKHSIRDLSQQPKLPGLDRYVADYFDSTTQRDIAVSNFVHRVAPKNIDEAILEVRMYNTVSLISIDGNNIFRIRSDRMLDNEYQYFDNWLSGDKEITVVYFTLDTTDDIIRNYLEKYPSTIQKESYPNILIEDEDLGYEYSLYLGAVDDPDKEQDLNMQEKKLVYFADYEGYKVFLEIFPENTDLNLYFSEVGKELVDGNVIMYIEYEDYTTSTSIPGFDNAAVWVSGNNIINIIPESGYDITDSLVVQAYLQKYPSDLS